MYPPVYTIAADDAAVKGALGNPPRFTPFGKAPQNETRPYAVWQTVYGAPENSLSCVPDIDNFGVQIDVYAKTVSGARDAARALRDAYEATHNPVVAWNGEDWEVSTGLYRVSMTVEFWTHRNDS